MRGRFVVFEGGEASGKSTQAALLAARLGAVLTRQPGGTEIGNRIRALLLDNATTGLDARAETLLMAADKAQHVAEVIEPALRAGRDVVCDRYVASSVVYQGHGRGIDRSALDELLRFATFGLAPDLTLLLDVPDQLVQERLGRQRDRFESEPPDFHARVRAGYAVLAAAEPDRWAVVDGTGTVEHVAARVAAVIGQRLAARVQP